MNILYKLNVTSHKELYDLTKNPSIKKLTSIKGEVRRLACAVLYEDVKQDGEVQKILSFKCADTGDIFATNSPTFIRDFEDARDMLADFGEEIHSVKIESGVSRAGRTFISCVYID